MNDDIAMTFISSTIHAPTVYNPRNNSFQRRERVHRYIPRVGDWICPSNACNFKNFGSRSRCRECGIPKFYAPSRRGDRTGSRRQNRERGRSRGRGRGRRGRDRGQGRRRGRGRERERGRGRGRGRLYSNVSRRSTEAERLLCEWGLQKYAQNILNEGWDDVLDWSELTESILLNDCYLKKGDVKKFYRKYNEWTKTNNNDNDDSAKMVMVKDFDDEKYNLEDVIKDFKLNLNNNYKLYQKRIIYDTNQIQFYGTKSDILAYYYDYVDRVIFAQSDKDDIVTVGIHNCFVDIMIERIKAPLNQIQLCMPSTTSCSNLEKFLHDGLYKICICYYTHIKLNISKENINHLFAHISYGVAVYSSIDEKTKKLKEKKDAPIQRLEIAVRDDNSPNQNDDAAEGDHDVVHNEGNNPDDSDERDNPDEGDSITQNDFLFMVIK